MVDESELELGTRLMLPPWLEADRPAIEASLQPVSLPEISYAG
jgi:hypothetical protein